MSTWLCGLNPFRKKLEGDKDLSPEDKNNIANKMESIAKDFASGTYKNIKDANYNNPETFEWLWKKYTKLPSINPSEFPVNYKHVRRFELGLKYYDNLVSKPKGIFASKFHLPRRAMQNFPELQRFEKNLVNETSFFRDYTVNSTKNVNEFLQNLNDLALNTGEKGFFSKLKKKLSKHKRLRNLYDEYSSLQQQYLRSSSLKNKQVLSKKLRENRDMIKSFYETGSGEAFKMMNSVMEGADIATITNSDGTKLTPIQRKSLEQMRENYKNIRKAGALGLVRGLQKIKSMAKEKDVKWASGVIDKVEGLIKNIEFQKQIDEEGVTTDYKNLASDRDFLRLGFKTNEYSTNGKLAFSKHYMSQYSLGLLKTIKKIESSVQNHDRSLSEEIRAEINSWDDITNVAKGRNPIANPVYDADPYFFLNKYVSDVGIFNYRTHVKDNFTKAHKAIVSDHLNPAKEKGRKDLIESANGMLDLINDVYTEIQQIDPNRSSHIENIMRTMQSITYFRLMGGNVRSAARNATQRAYEFIEFGYKAMLKDVPNFYKNVGSSDDNQTKLIRQQKKYGLQWFDGKTVRSNAFDIATGKDANISAQSRGALEESYVQDKDLYVDKNGELQVADSENWSARTARVAANAGRVSGKLHKVVEDWNRSKTFRAGFALASMNLNQTSRTWRSQQILKRFESDILSKKGSDYIITEKDLKEKYGNKSDKIMNDWVENKAGELAYSGVLDLHFEYSNWNKAKAIRVTGKENKATMMAKIGLGQFAHYRFEMTSLMHKWLTEAGLNPKQNIGAARAGDFQSEEFMRPMRFAMLQALIWGGSSLLGTNFEKLMPNDVMETGEALYLHARVKAKLATNEITEDQINQIKNDTTGKIYQKFTHGELIRDWMKATYGQGGATFLGPNAPLIMSAYEMVAKSNLDGKVDPLMENAFDTAFKTYKKTDKKWFNTEYTVQETYDFLSRINSQLARTVSYTAPNVYSGGYGLRDIAWLELGLFSSKQQRENRRWLLGQKKKSRKKSIFQKKNVNRRDLESVILALDKMG